MSEPDSDPQEFKWPLCPDCGRRLFAMCPYCETPGNRFTYTEAAWEGDRDVYRVICPTCDEAFEPRFQGRCHGCGHKFNPDIDSPAPLDEQTEYEDENNSRAVYALLGIVAILAALAAYFVWLLR